MTGILGEKEMLAIAKQITNSYEEISKDPKDDNTKCLVDDALAKLKTILEDKELNPQQKSLELRKLVRDTSIKAGLSKNEIPLDITEALRMFRSTTAKKHPCLIL